MADPLPNLLLILFGPLTPYRTLGTHSLDEPAEPPHYVALVFA